MSVTVATDIGSYCEPVVETNGSTWPDAGQRLLHELSMARSRYALIDAGPKAADQLIDSLAGALDLSVVYLGAALAACELVPTTAEVDAACSSATILTDLDLLLWPTLGIPILPLLEALARRRPVIAVWPGEIIGHRARYSIPGRPDHHDRRLTDVVVLRPRTARFPDEVPYQIERIAP